MINHWLFDESSNTTRPLPKHKKTFYNVFAGERYELFKIPKQDIKDIKQNIYFCRNFLSFGLSLFYRHASLYTTLVKFNKTVDSIWIRLI